MLHNNPNKNADGLVATAEPEHGSRCIFLCFTFFIGVAILATTIALVMFSEHFHPTNTTGRALQVISRVMGFIGIVVTILWLIVLGVFVQEVASSGDPDDLRFIDLFV